MITSDGTYYTRIHSAYDNIRREKFVTLVLNEAPGVRVTQTRILDQPKDMIDWIINQNPNEKEYWNKLPKNQNSPSEVSLAVYFSGEIGKDFLAKKGFYHENNESLARISDPNDLTAVFNALINTWSIATVMGVRDFHYNNWIYHAGKVIGIDFAYPYLGASPPLSLNLIRHRFLFSASDINSELRNELLRFTGPELRDFIAHQITQDYLLAKASEAGYRPFPHEIDETLARVEAMRELKIR